jgi:hypothetical protein
VPSGPRGRARPRPALLVTRPSPHGAPPPWCRWERASPVDAPPPLPQTRPREPCAQRGRARPRPALLVTRPSPHGAPPPWCRWERASPVDAPPPLPKRAATRPPAAGEERSALPPPRPQPTAALSSRESAARIRTPAGEAQRRSGSAAVQREARRWPRPPAMPSWTDRSPGIRPIARPSHRCRELIDRFGHRDRIGHGPRSSGLRSHAPRAPHRRPGAGTQPGSARPLGGRRPVRPQQARPRAPRRRHGPPARHPSSATIGRRPSSTPPLCAIAQSPGRRRSERIAGGPTTAGPTCRVRLADRTPAVRPWSPA